MFNQQYYQPALCFLYQRLNKYRFCCSKKNCGYKEESIVSI